MFRQVMNALTAAARAMKVNPGALALSFALYLAFVAVLYLFVTTPEATVGQLVLTLLLGVVAVALFFILQRVGIGYTAEGVQTKALLRGSLGGFWKLFVVSLPIAVLVILGIYAFDRLEHLMTRGTPWPEGGFVYERVIPALRLIYFYIVLPLAAIQLWIAATHEGLGPAFRGIGRHFVKAFAPRTLLTYALVLVVFGAILYVILFTKTPVKSAWLEIGLLGARLTLAGLVIFFGWLLGVGALAEVAGNAHTDAPTS